MSKVDPDRLMTFGLIAALATTARLVMVWLGLPETHLISDDAYYYFVTARHLAAGLGPTFDGQAITNGFHPLWLLVLTPVFRMFPHDLWLPVRSALSLTVLLDLGSGYLIYDLLRRRAGPGTAVFASAAWFLLPPTALLGLHGLEASLSTVLMLLLLRQLDRGGEVAAWSWRSALAAGAWLGLAGLARTDNLPSAGLAVAAIAFLRPSPATAMPRLRWLVGAAGAAVIVTAPWFIWNLVRFGTMLQVSGQVKLHVHELFGGLPWGWGDAGSATLTLLHMLFAPLLIPAKYLTGEQFDGGRFALPVALVSQALILFLFVLGARRRMRSGTWRQAPFVFPVVYLIVHVILFGFMWRSYATWYAHTCFAFIIVLLAGGRGVAASGAPTRPGGGRSRVFLVAALVLCAVQLVQYPLYFSRISLGARGPEKQFRPDLDRMQSQVPGGLRLGAFDAGALAYVAGTYPGFTVINLDGLVNNRIYEAYREGRYADWVLAHVDVVVQDLRRARLFCGPEDVERLRLRYGQAGR